MKQHLIDLMKKIWTEEKIERFRESWPYREAITRSVNDYPCIMRMRYYRLKNELDEEYRKLHGYDRTDFSD